MSGSGASGKNRSIGNACSGRRLSVALGPRKFGRFMTRRSPLALLGILALGLAAVARAQEYTFTRLAGSPGGSGAEDGIGSAARFSMPQGITSDGHGSLYVADRWNRTIRKISRSTREVTTFAGIAGLYGATAGKGHRALFQEPIGIAADGHGHLYVVDGSLR